MANATVTKKSTAPATRKSAKRTSTKGSKAAKLLEMAEAYDAGAVRLTKKQRADVERWALSKTPRNILAPIAIKLAIQEGQPWAPPADPAPVPSEQLVAVWAWRLDYANDILGDAIQILWHAMDRLTAVTTLAGEYDQLNDDGPGREKKRLALMSAVHALGADGKETVQGVIDMLDVTSMKMRKDVRPEHIKEMEEAKAELAGEAAQAQGGEHG